MANINQLANEVLQLNSRERAFIAETLWQSLEEPFLVSDDDLDLDSIKLAIKRDDEIETGVVKVISHKEMMNRLRKNEG